MSKHLYPARRSTAIALTALALAVSGALASPTALASGFQISENTAQALGRAFAGREAAGNDASVVVNNPAAMAGFDRAVLQFDATAINVSTKFSGSGKDGLGRPLTGGDGGNGGGIHPVPAITLIVPVADAWRLGLGIGAPFGLATEYESGWVGRYQALKSSVKSMDVTGSLSWAVSSNFSLGASVIMQKTTVDLSNAINYGAVLAGAPFNLAPTFMPQSADGTLRVRGDNTKLGWQLGAQWKPTSQDTLALAYRAKINHRIDGMAYYTVPQSVQGVLAQAPAPYSSLFQNTKGVGEFATPATASLSYWHNTDGALSWGAELGWTGWSSFNKLAIDFANPVQPDVNIPYNWRNTVFASVGLDYRANDKWTLRTGVAYDQTPTQDFSRDPRIPDGARKWLSFGAGYQASDKLTMNIGYTHLFVADGTVNNHSPTNDTLVGTFKNSGDLLSVSAQFKF